MKKLAIIILSAATLTAACKKEYDSVYSFEDKSGKAKVKFVHALVNAYPLPDTASQGGLQLFLNGTKISGSNVTYGGGVFPGLEYSMLPAGNNTLKAVIPAGSKNPDEATVLDAPLNLSDGKTYTAFIVDSLPNSSLLLVEDDFSPVADSGKYFVRLVNLSPNADSIALYSTPETSKLDSNITYKKVGGWKQSFVGSGARAFGVRIKSATTNLISINITPVQGRMYTILFYGVLGKGGTRAPKLAFYTSRFQTYDF